MPTTQLYHIISLTPCDPGKRQRPVSCIRDDGVTVPSDLCTAAIASLNMTLVESCEVPCTQDCELSPFTPWSSCDAPCGTRAMKARKRDVVMPGNDWGRKCPGLDAMLQVRGCLLYKLHSACIHLVTSGVYVTSYKSHPLYFVFHFDKTQVPQHKSHPYVAIYLQHA